ncbi:MAG TPA: 2OG-Fe dioxygenase family protein, partial [Povalibacter sp.]|nr:2OG-Fe dioxygenase family protein [Povalibacter sp.]
MLRSSDVSKLLNDAGYVLLSPARMQQELHLPIGRLDDLRASWSQLPRDTWLRDGGRYRHRRHSCFIQELPAGTVTAVPHRAHWQPRDYNALHGGMERWFEPIDTQVASSAIWGQLL